MAFVRYVGVQVCVSHDLSLYVSTDYHVGLVTNSILFCWLFTIKDLCITLCFIQTQNKHTHFYKVEGAVSAKKALQGF